MISYEAHFKNAVTSGGENRCIGWRKGEEDYQWLSYNEVAKRAHRFGSGLLHLGLKPVCICNNSGWKPFLTLSFV